MKILVFNWRCWLNPAAGGAEIFTKEVLTNWTTKGHKITLFTSQYPNSKPEETSNGVQIIRAGGKYSVYSKAKKYYKKIFSKQNYDVVIDEINTRPFQTPKFVNNNETIIALIHQLAREYWFYETRFPINYIGYHYLEKKWLKNYTNIPTFTVSKSTKEDLIELGFNKIFEVSEGLNFNPLNNIPTKEPYPVIVYSGRLKSPKRPNHAIEAFKLVKKKISNAQLWIIGEGPLKNKLEKNAINDVKFFSNLSNQQRRKKIKKAWILINPSIREGWGLNVIEANALGTPCVAYNVKGLRDSIKHNQTGLLVESGNISKLSQAIIKVINNKELRNNLGENALKYSRQFSWEKTANNFLDIIQQIITDK